MTQEEFTRAVLALKNRSLNVAARILKGDGDYSPEDAFQEACLKAWKNLASFREESSFETWFTRIVWNCCLAKRRSDRERQSGFREFVRREGLCTMASQEEDCVTNERNAALAKAFGKLDEIDLLILTMRGDGVPFPEIACSLGIKVAHAKTIAFRARGKLRFLLKHPNAPKPVGSRGETDSALPLTRSKGAGRP